MPTDQPNNAPLNAAPARKDDLTAAAVLSDDRLDTTPGGGGLLGSGGDPLGGSAKASGGASPNAPGAGGNGQPEREAQVRSLEDTSEAHPS